MRGQHFVGAVSVAVAGERAVAETRAMLLVRGALKKVEVDVTCDCRMYDFFVGAWRIRTRGMIYEKDRMDPVDPSMTIDLSKEELARYPEGYRSMRRRNRGLTPINAAPGPTSA